MTHRPNAITHTREYRVLPGVLRHTFIFFRSLYEAKPVPPWHKILATPLKKPLLRQDIRLCIHSGARTTSAKVLGSSGRTFRVLRRNSHVGDSFRPSWTRTLTDVVASPARTCDWRATASCSQPVPDFDSFVAQARRVFDRAYLMISYTCSRLKYAFTAHGRQSHRRFGGGSVRGFSPRWVVVR